MWPQGYPIFGNREDVDNEIRMKTTRIYVEKEEK